MSIFISAKDTETWLNLFLFHAQRSYGTDAFHTTMLGVTSEYKNCAEKAGFIHVDGFTCLKLGNGYMGEAGTARYIDVSLHKVSGSPLRLDVCERTFRPGRGFSKSSVTTTSFYLGYGVKKSHE